MYNPSANLPPSGAFWELISCATRLRFEYLAVNYICNPSGFDLMKISLPGIKQFIPKKAIILSVNTAFYSVKVELAGFQQVTIRLQDGDCNIFKYEPSCTWKRRQIRRRIVHGYFFPTATFSYTGLVFYLPMVSSLKWYQITFLNAQ